MDEFHAPFHSEQLVLQVYKKELHNHVEACLGSNLRARLSTALALNMETSQKEMAGNNYLYAICYGSNFSSLTHIFSQIESLRCYQQRKNNSEWV